MEKSVETENILSMIKDYSGLVPNEAHKTFLESFIKKRREELLLSEKEYTELLKKDEDCINPLKELSDSKLLALMTERERQ